MRDAVARLGDRFRAALDPLLAGVGRCALLDFPNHGNVGDSAIWLGERAYLRGRGIDVVYTCDLDTYTPSRLRAALGPDDPILLHGGGNFGDLYPRHQRLREQVAADFPRHRIIQLPQTIRFESEDAVERARGTLGRHGGFTVLVRDEPSRRMASERLGLPAHLSPDAAFALGPLPRDRPVVDLLWLRRSDGERAGGDRPAAGEDDGGPSTEVADWLLPPGGGSAARAGLFAAGRWTLARCAPARELARRAMAHRFDAAADRELARGTALLSRGRVVVTDRLHGHILSLLLGIPHVVLDTRHGKISAFREAWTRDAAGVAAASTPADAGRAARALLSGGGGRSAG